MAKTICSFNFNGKKKHLYFTTPEKQTADVIVESINDIWNYAAEIVESAKVALQ